MSGFSVLNNQAEEQNEDAPVNTNEVDTRIKALVESAPVFVFMKGTPAAPQCGFSQNVIQLLKNSGCSYKTFDVLSDHNIRQGVKKYANWPTIPQVYIKGEFVGGNDILMDMESSGELQKLISDI